MLRQIRAIQDLIRQDPGIDSIAKVISQMSWMIFLKIIDDLETQRELNKNYKSPIPNQYRWHNWNYRHFSETELVTLINEAGNFLRYLDFNGKFGINSESLKDSDNFMVSGVLIREVMDHINELNFSEKENRQNFSDIYDNLLSELQTAGMGWTILHSAINHSIYHRHHQS
jgi:type I restriction enzyme M protein